MVYLKPPFGTVNLHKSEKCYKTNYDVIGKLIELDVQSS